MYATVSYLLGLSLGGADIALRSRSSRRTGSPAASEFYEDLAGSSEEALAGLQPPTRQKDASALGRTVRHR